tara:strand:+ start:278 stop:964 length:687 start_codon:yes stop_codon:yes gene_type:complete
MAGTLQAQHILSRVRNILQDNSGVRWTDGELFDYLSDAQREIANIRPDATATHSNVQLATGTEQTIPADGLRLVKVVRNMSGSGTDATGARSIRVVSEDALDSTEPNWHDPTVTGDATHGTEVKHYIFDGDDPRVFYVYPGVAGSAYVELVYSKNPTNIGANTDLIQVDDIFANALINYVLYRASLKDAEFAGNQQRAGTYYQLFSASLARGGVTQQAVQPDQGVING